MKYQVTYIVQGVFQFKRFKTYDEAARFRQWIKTNPEVSNVSQVQQVF